MTKKITVQVYKYDGQLHYEWDAYLDERSDTYAILYEFPNRALTHHTRGKTFSFPTYSVEWIPFDEWFTVHIGIDHKGHLQYYCNICLPPTYRDDIISFIDLDIDLIREDGEWTVVDEDEFHLHRIKYNYPNEVIKHVLHTRDDILYRIEHKQYPFNGFLHHYVKKLSTK